VGIKVQHARFAAALVIGTITLLALAFNVSQGSNGPGTRISFGGERAAASTFGATSTATPTATSTASGSASGSAASAPEIADPIEVIVGKRFCERQAAHTTASQVFSLPTGLPLRAVKAVLGAPATERGNVSTYCATTPEGTTIAIRFFVDDVFRVTSII
jgi:hypothetical protein